MIKMNTIIRILLVLSLSIAFFGRVGGVQVISEDVGFSILLAWSLIALFKFIYDKYCGDKIYERNLIGCIFKYNNVVRFVIYAYTVFLVLSGITMSEYLSSNIKTFINGVSAISIFYLFKEDAWKLSLISVSLAYVYSILAGVILFGNFSFELHDLAFSTGYVLLYYIYKKTIHGFTVKLSDFKYEFLAFVIFILAFKRIGVLAMVLTLLFNFIFGRFSERKKNNIIKISGIVFILFCYLFVYSIISGDLFLLIDALGINASGRTYYYAVVADICDFKISFLGHGRNSISYILTHYYSYLNVGNVHSDILRMYAENGFILFGIWLLNYLLMFPSKMTKMFGSKVGFFTFLCVLYTFIVYLTDNTELYLMNNYFFMLTVMQYAHLNKEYISEKRHVKIRLRLRR